MQLRLSEIITSGCLVCFLQTLPETFQCLTDSQIKTAQDQMKGSDAENSTYMAAPYSRLDIWVQGKLTEALRV